MNDNNKLPKQAKPQEFELIELLFREYISSHIARPDIEYSFQARFQSFINQIPSYLHSSSKTGFFTHFFFGSFASLLDTTLGQKLGIQKLHFNFDKANHLRIVAETDDKTHVFIFTENKQNKKHNKKNKIDFTKDEWKTITGQEYTDNKKLEISVIQINKSTGSINVVVEKKNIQDGVSSTTQYHEITKQFINKDGQYIPLEDSILILSNNAPLEVSNELKLILNCIKKIHDNYQGLPYGDGAKEADEHGFVAGIFNNFRYRENAHVYLEQFAGKGYADIVLLVRGADRSTNSIPIIIELKAGTGSGTNADDALRQVEEYTKGFQPNNMRILSLADNILCVGVNLDMPTDSFIQTQVVARNQEIVPLIQSITDSVNKIKDSNLDIIKQEIQSNLEKTYNTFPGTGEKSSAHYMSRFMLGESLVLRDYDKHIFIYDKESYIDTAKVINDHATRSNKKQKIERTVDASNAVNSILFIPTSSANSPVILVNIIDVNRDVVVNSVRLDSGLIGNRKIVQLNIQFNIDKHKESFAEYCNIKLLKIYDSISEYNQASIQVQGKLHLIAEDISDNLLEHLQQTISSQKGLVLSERYYKELLGKVGEVVYPIKSLIAREAEFQGLLEGIFKYYSDVKLSEGSERRELVLTEFQTGAGGRIDMLVQAIGLSEQGTKEYIPVGLELKYDNSIKLDSFGKKQDENIQKILLEGKEQQVVEKLLQDQTERYSKGAAIKSITDGNQVAILGIVFNAQADNADSLLLTTDKFMRAKVVHSSKLYTISDINDDISQLKSEITIRNESIIMENLDNIDVPQIEDVARLLNNNLGIQKITIFNSEITDAAMARLSNVLMQSNNMIISISFQNTNLDATKAEQLINLLQQNNHIVYLDVTGNDNLDIESKNKLNNLLHHNQRIHQKIKSIFSLYTVDDMSSNVFIPDWVDIRRDQMRDNNIIVQNIDDIDRCYQDTALDLSNTMLEDSKINQVVTWLKNHKDVDFLDLSNNQLSSIGVEQILDYLIGNQHKISLLDISENNIGPNSQAIIKLASLIQDNNVHGPALKFLNLHDIDIHYNDVSNIFRALVENTSIEHLDISSNDVFSTVHHPYITNPITQILYTHPALLTLDLSNTGLTNLLIRDIVLIQRIYHQKYHSISLTELNIAGNAITKDGMESLGQLISSARQLQILDISNNRIGTQTLYPLIYHLKYTKISTLRMSNIDLNNDIQNIGNVIKDLNIQILDISHNNIGVQAVIDIFRSISHRMENSDNKLVQLNLSGNTIDLDNTMQAAAINAMSNALDNNDVMRSLDISDMNIQDNFLSELVVQLKTSNIEHLNISGNEIGEFTISSLESYLLLNPPLKLLNISANTHQGYHSLITAQDIYILFEALSGNSQLTHLNLSYNNLDYESISTIYTYLQQNHALEYLDLSHNNLSIESIHLLFQGLSSNNQLQYLDIRHSQHIDDPTALEILGVLKLNKGLKILHISYQDLSEDSISKFTSELLDIKVEIDGYTRPKVNPMHQNDNLLDLDYQTFERETGLKQYNYWLQQHDIVDIARVQYGFSDNGLEVVGSIDQLSRVINGYKSNNNNISPFTIICNIGNDNKGSNHWVSLVLNRQDTNYHGYYIDSFGRSIPGNIASILHSYHILIVPLSIQQQADGHNCGLWALENAQTICQALQNNANTALDTNSLQDRLTSSRSATEWRHIRDNVYNQLINDDIRISHLRDLGLLQDHPVRVLDSKSPDSIISLCLPGASRSKRSIDKCKIGWGDIDTISVNNPSRNIEEIVIDAKKFLEYSKLHVEDEVKSLQLVRLAEEVRSKGDGKIVGKYQGLLEQVIQDKSYKNYLQQERINAIGHHVIDRDSYSISPRLKLKLINAAGKIQLIHGVHILVVSCQEGSSADCTLGVIELGYSFLSQPIENIMVRTVPRMMHNAADVVSHIVPKLSYNTKFVVQVLERGYATKLAKGGAGAIASIFDIVDIVIASKALIECNKRADSNNVCSAKEIRDNIVAISFASVSFVSGIALVAIGSGTAVVGIGLVIMVGQGIYSGISNIIEYEEKYDTTHTENWHIFWRTFFLQRMSEDIEHLVARDKTINDITENAWQILNNSTENIVAYAIGLGKEEVQYFQQCIQIEYVIDDPGSYAFPAHPECSEYSSYHIEAAYSKIDMSYKAADTSKLSRVLPKGIVNATMICLPKITQADYEKGLVQSRSNATYECDNAVVMLHNHRQSSLPMKDRYIVYDLRYVNSGSIIGSNALNNIFQIVQGGPQIFGSSNVENIFNILNSKYHGKIYLSDNSTNIIDVSNLSDDVISMEYTHIYPLTMNMSIVSANSSQIYSRSKDIKIRYIGRKNKVDKIICKQLLYIDHKTVHDNEVEHNNIIIDSGGGKYYNSSSNYDQIQNCSTVIVSPNTLVQGSKGNYTIYIKSLSYAADYRAKYADSKIDIVGRGTVVFPEISLLKDSIEIKILPILDLSIIIPLGHNAQYTLVLKNYLNQDLSTNYVLIDKYGSNIIVQPTISNNNLIIRHFVLYVECHFDTLREVVEHYRNITYSREEYVIFSTVKNTQYNHFFKFGSSERDIIIINEDVVYVEGNDGSDLYIINNHIDYRVKINNKAEDLQLDILKLPVNNINDIGLIEDINNLHLLFNNTDAVEDNKYQGIQQEVLINNYFQDNIYQHIAIMDRNNNSYICFKDSGVTTLLPFYHASLEHNIFILSSNSKKAVLHINQANIVFYKQKNDLLLTDKQEHSFNSLSLILQDYYIKQHQWFNVTLYGYNNAVISIIDLHNITVSAINYEQEYNSTIKEYVVNLTVGSHEIEQNKQIFNDQLAKEDNQEKIGVVILKGTSFDSIGIVDHNNDLILSDLYNRTLTIKNWYKDDQYKISMFEFDTGIEPEIVYVSHEFANKIKLNNRLSNEISKIDNAVVNTVISYVILNCGQQDRLAKRLTYSFLEDENNRLNSHNLSLEEIIEDIKDGHNDTSGKALLLLVAKAYNKLLLKYNIEKEDISQNSCFNTILSHAIIQEIIECINTSTNFSRIEQFINNKKHAIGTIITKLVTVQIGSDNQHKHRHHHGENHNRDQQHSNNNQYQGHKSPIDGEHVAHHRGRRDIDNSWNVVTKDSNHEHDDHLLDARDDIFVVRNAGSSLEPLGYNIVNWIRDNILTFNIFNPIRQVKNSFNAYNDKTRDTIYDVDISDNAGCKESQKQDGLVKKFSIVQEINDQIYELGEKKVAAEKLLRALCQQLNNVEKDMLIPKELEYTIINIYQEEEDLTIKLGDLQDKKQELYHIKEQIELQKSLIESLRCELNSLNQELAMSNVEDNNLSLYHELPYWNKSLEEDVEVDDDITDQVPIWIRSNHHINVGNLPNSFIGNDTDKNQVLDDSLCDFQGTLSLWNLLMRKKYGVHYNHQHDIMQSEEVNTEYAHRLAYKAYAAIYDNSQENIELSGISMVD